MSLAAFSIPFLLRLVGPTLPRADTVAVDLRVVAFTFGLALMTGCLAGLVPALQSARVDLRDALNEGGRSGMGGGRLAAPRSCASSSSPRLPSPSC